MQNYTIKEASEQSGLPESTLRYYETMELIGPIARDPSTKYRLYSEDDVNFAMSVGCISATGMSIDDMKKYFGNGKGKGRSPEFQIALLEGQKGHLEKEKEYLLLKQRYVDIKIAYWKAIAAGHVTESQEIAKRALEIARTMRQPKKK